MIVVADASPIHYLVVIEREWLLTALYGRAVIPPVVASELSHQNAPETVRAWLATRPGWLEVQQPAGSLGTEVDIDKGQREAIALASDLLLVDDWDARQEARRRGLPVAGTLRVLADGAAAGLSDLAS